MNKGGRPRKISSPEEFDALVDAYVEECTEKEVHITWTGLALYMGFYGKDELANYREYDGFSRSSKRAMLIVENAYESRLHGNSPTGAIFALKNLNWSDRQELDHTSSDKSMSPRPLTDFYPSKGKPVFGSGDEE